MGYLMFAAGVGSLALARFISLKRGRGNIFAPFVLPATDLATTVHRGSHDDIDVTYGALGSYVSRHALQVAGPVREIYHVGPRDTDDSSLWCTEIGWPIFQTAPER